MTSERAPSRLWRRLAGRLPSAVGDELNTSARRLMSVRRPRDLMPTLEAEVGRLARAAVPVLAEHPLPIRRRRLGEALAAATGALAAGVVELDELAVVVTDGAAAPTVPGAGVAFLVAFVLELWIAVSLRVHQIEAAGRTVDRVALISEVNTAVLDVDAHDGHKLAGGVAKAIGKRLARRWVAGLAPGVGIVIDGEAARRTVSRIWQLPLALHPRG